MFYPNPYARSQREQAKDERWTDYYHDALDAQEQDWIEHGFTAATFKANEAQARATADKMLADYLADD